MFKLMGEGERRQSSLFRVMGGGDWRHPCSR